MADVLGLKNEDSSPDKNSPGRNEVASWLRQIKAAEKREEKYRARANRALKVYEMNEDTDAPPFNVLYSNTETLQPALYNDLPRPVVKRRWKDESPLAKFGAEAISRGISYTMDNPTSGYDSLHTLMDDVVLSALVPGRGMARLFYDADIQDYGNVSNEKEMESGESQDEEVGDLDGEESKMTEAEDPEGEKAAVEQQAQQAAPMVKSEYICARLQKWDQVVFGYSKKWDGVPWIAYYSDMTKKDVEKSFGKSWAKKLKYSSKADEDKGTSASKDEQEKRPENTCRIWEIWHKSARKIIFIAENYAEGIIKREEDPLKLTNFYNMPEPLHFGRKLTSLIPTPIYEYYRKQAEELNHLTQRIDAVTEAIKVRGFYDGGLQKIGSLMQQPDNTIIAAEGVGQFKDGVKLQDMIWFAPIQEFVQVLQQLVQERENVKRVIYEITGIADILRGSSVASETATAQNIKDKWGTLRLKKMQKRVQRYVKECFSIMAEIMGEHFSEETFAQMTQLPIQTTAAKQKMQAEFDALQQQMQQQPPNPEPGGPQPGTSPPGSPQGPGGPPQPQPQAPDPNQQKMQQMQQELSKPSWGDVLGMLKQDLLRGYLIDVETNSTVDPEAVEDREAFAEMMTGMGQAFQQFIPAVQQGVLSMPTLKALLKGVTRRYNIGTEFEDSIEALPNELPPPPPDPKMEIAKMEAEGLKVEQQGKQQEQAQKAKLMESETNNKMQLMQAEVAVQKAELEIKREELELKKMELAMKREELQVKSQDTQVQVTRQRELAQVKHDGMLTAARTKAMLAGQPPMGAQGANIPV